MPKSVSVFDVATLRRPNYFPPRGRCYAMCKIPFLRSYVLFYGTKRREFRRGTVGKVCRDGKKKTGNQLCELGAPRRGGGATLLKFGCGVVSIKIAGINISRGEKRFTRFPRKEMIPPRRAAPFGYKSPARSIILMSIRRALIATRLINRELYL